MGYGFERNGAIFVVGKPRHGMGPAVVASGRISDLGDRGLAHSASSATC